MVPQQSRSSPIRITAGWSSTVRSKSCGTGATRSAAPTRSSSVRMCRRASQVGRLVQRPRAGVTAFYDIDTPVTLAKLERRDFEYLSPEIIPGYDLYLSFTGGPTLRRIERQYGSPMARALYCSVDPEAYPSLEEPRRWDLTYLGTYSDDRQPTLEKLLIEPARRLPHLQVLRRRSAISGRPSTGPRTSSGSSISRLPSTPNSMPPRDTR